MDDNTELEEGEACYYKDDDDDNIDLDSLSYIVRVFSHLNLLWLVVFMMMIMMIMMDTILIIVLLLTMVFQCINVFGSWKGYRICHN